MSNPLFEPTLKHSTIYRATFTSYLALTGVYVILGGGYLFLYLRNPGHDFELGAIAAWGVALLWWVWLRGFKITVTEEYIAYRDGFFRSSRILISEIASIRNEWIQWKVFGRKIKILRIGVIARSGKTTIRINPKPFGRSALKKIRTIVR